MADVEWPVSEEALIAVLRDKVNEHHKLLYGNGQPGILDFVAGLRGQMRLIMALLLFLSTIAAVGTLLVAIHTMKTGELDIPGFSHSAPPSPTYAEQQDATIPLLARSAQ